MRVLLSLQVYKAFNKTAFSNRAVFGYSKEFKEFNTLTSPTRMTLISNYSHSTASQSSNVKQDNVTMLNNTQRGLLYPHKRWSSRHVTTEQRHSERTNKCFDHTCFLDTIDVGNIEIFERINSVNELP